LEGGALLAAKDRLGEHLLILSALLGHLDLQGELELDPTKGGQLLS
jgi:hypothetical protein